MDDIFVYLTDLPDGIREMVVPCGDGNYTVYLSAKMDDAHRIKAYQHALDHIHNHDFQKTDVQQIEAAAHGLTPAPPPEETYEEKRRKRFEEMRKKNARARKRIQKQLAKKQKQVEFLLETDAEYRREHKLFDI